MHKKSKMEGWIKLHRGILDWEWSDCPEMVALFVHLLCRANPKETEWHGMKVERGQIVTGRKELAKKTGISERTIRTCIERLKSTNEITIKSTNKFSIVTICNFDKYQLQEEAERPTNCQQIDQQPTSNRPATDQQPTTDKEYKNIINKYSLSLNARANDFCYDLDSIKDMLLNQSGEWKETVQRFWFSAHKISLTTEQVDDYIKQFVDYLKMKGEEMKSLLDARSHFTSWMENRYKQVKSDKKQSDNNKKITSNDNIDWKAGESVKLMW